MAKYPDLKSYLQVNYKDLLLEEVQKFVVNKYDGGGFHSFNVVSVLKHTIENLEVKALTCHDAPGPIVKMDVGVAADIVDLGLGKKDYEASRKRHWFTIYLQGILRDGLTNVKAISTEEFSGGKFQKENALDQFLVPYIYSADLEGLAEDFTGFYCHGAIYDGYRLPIGHILNELEITYYSADLPANCFGRMYFRKATATVYRHFPYCGEIKEENKTIEPGTMLISRDKYYLGGDGTQLLTIAHEIIHWFLHQKYFKILALLDDKSDMMSCEVEPSCYEESMTMAQKAHWYAEWQANALALRIAMPRLFMMRAFQKARAAAHPYFFTGDFVEDILSRIAELFDVPIFAAKQRARQLDLDNADGAFVYVDGEWHNSFWFTEGSLERNQTFVINRAGYERLYKKDTCFAELINSGEFIYLGYVVCINDPKYVALERFHAAIKLKLTDYAREHADECCLKFSIRSTSYLRDIQDKYEFYGESYLSKEVKAENYVEHYFDKEFNLKPQQSIDEIREAVAAYNATNEATKKVKMEMLQNNCNSFADALIYHMDRKKITIDQLVERAGLSDTTIKNYRNGVKNPPIENVMAVCIGLNLPRSYSEDLLDRAGYKLNNTPQRRAYNFLLDYDDGTLEQWNLILDAFHQPHIPNLRNQKKNINS